MQYIKKKDIWNDTKDKKFYPGLDPFIGDTISDNDITKINIWTLKKCLTNKNV